VECEGKEYVVDVENGVCTCGKYQIYLMPCAHACSVINMKPDDPYKYVSSIYSKETLKKMVIDIIPVVNEPVKCPSDKSLLRRGPGRPKKTSLSKKKNGLNKQILV
jgi:hypothetical protein